MNAKLQGNKLILTIDLSEEPWESSTRKKLFYHFSPWGNLGVQHADHPLQAMVQVAIRNPDYGK